MQATCFFANNNVNTYLDFFSDRLFAVGGCQAQIALPLVEYYTSKVDDWTCLDKHMSTQRSGPSNIRAYIQ